MNHERANNESRQKTISIVTRLLVVKLKELGLTPRKGKIFPRARSMPIEYGAHTDSYSVSPVNKDPGNETDKISYLQMKDVRYILLFPLRFVRESFTFTYCS